MTNSMCKVKERGGEELFGPDLVRLQNFICKLDQDQDKTNFTIKKEGLVTAASGSPSRPRGRWSG